MSKKQKLTEAEEANIVLLKKDLGIKQVAASRGVSENTVKAQICTAKLKYGVGTLHGLIAKHMAEALLLILFAVLALLFLLKHQHTTLSQLPNGLITTIEQTKTL